MRDTLLNEEMIAIHQDRLAKPGMRIMYAPCGDYQCEIWARPLSDAARSADGTGSPVASAEVRSRASSAGTTIQGRRAGAIDVPSVRSRDVRGGVAGPLAA